MNIIIHHNTLLQRNQYLNIVVRLNFYSRRSGTGYDDAINNCYCQIEWQLLLRSNDKIQLV